MQRSGFFFLTGMFHFSTSSSLQLPHPHVNISPPFYNFTPVFLFNTFIQKINLNYCLAICPRTSVELKFTSISVQTHYIACVVKTLIPANNFQ